jgi:TRAP-type C4-dicarboxylate transport system substrate-binding protein
MNKARYEGLPADLKKIVDANSGVALSGQIGRIFAEAEAINRAKMPAASINTIPDPEIEEWKRASGVVVDGWMQEVAARGADGKALLATAQRLIAKYSRAER